MTSGHVIREATLADAETIAAYHHRCWELAFADLLEPGVVAAMDPWGKLARWRSWLAPDSDITTMVADLDGRTIAHTTVQGAKLVHLFVDPDHWGGGLGRELLTIGENLMWRDGQREVELNTMVGNQPAIALYLSQGWSMTDRLIHVDEGSGVIYDEHVLTKDL